jgi:hypothetical protein
VGPGYSARPCGQRESATDGWAPATMPGFKSPVRSNDQIHSNLNFKLVQTLTDPKLTFLCSKKFEIKYFFKDLEKVNNFLHKDFFTFEVDFE